jgi:hypothetical protein
LGLGDHASSEDLSKMKFLEVAYQLADEDH